VVIGEDAGQGDRIPGQIEDNALNTAGLSLYSVELPRMREE
jgi:hypothetical protein